VTVPVGAAGAGDQVTGRVIAVDDAGVTLAVEAGGKPGAKKRPPTPRLVPWGQLGSGRVQVEFGRFDDHSGNDHSANGHEELGQDDGAGDDDGGGE
jgi:ribosome maturation factor RimP